MSPDLRTLLGVLKASTKLKRSKADWAVLLEELSKADRAAVLEALVPTKVPKVKVPRVEDPLIASIKRAFSQIKGAMPAKIDALETSSPLARASGEGASRATWAKAVKHWRRTFSDEDILRFVTEYVDQLIASGQRTITLSV